jgi:hypothetical protein
MIESSPMLAQRADYGSDMTVRQRAQDLEIRRGSSCSKRALEDLAESGHLHGRPMGEVGESTVSDFAMLTIGFAEQDGGRRVAIGYYRHIHALIIANY